MKTFYIAAAAVLLLFCAWLGAQSATSQEFVPAHYALMQGDLSVAFTNGNGVSGLNIQKCVFKVDTRTGETWVLQLTIGGAGDPTVKSAVWAKVANSGIFYPNGPPMGM